IFSGKREEYRFKKRQGITVHALGENAPESEIRSRLERDSQSAVRGIGSATERFRVARRQCLRLSATGRCARSALSRRARKCRHCFGRHLDGESSRDVGAVGTWRQSLDRETTLRSTAKRCTK